MIGAGVNYGPLAGYAIALSRSGALDAELTGVDTDRELRRYSGLQLWIFVPSGTSEATSVGEETLCTPEARSD